MSYNAEKMEFKIKIINTFVPLRITAKKLKNSFILPIGLLKLLIPS